MIPLIAFVVFFFFLGGTVSGAPPNLVPGVWTNIGPSQVNFTNDKVHPVFTQGITLDPNNPDILYLGVCSYDVERAGLFKTIDRGTSWLRIGGGKFYNNKTFLDEPIRVRVNPKNSLQLYIADGVRGDTEGFFASVDGGKTAVLPQGFSDWQQTIGIFDVYDVAADPANFSHVLLSFHNPWRNGIGAGVAESLDGGNTWISHFPPPGSNWYAGMSIAFLGDSSTWLLGSQDNGYWRTADSGKTWKQVTTTNIQHGGGNLYKSKSGVLYASGSPRNLRSTDNGLTWTPVGPSNGYNAIFGDGNLIYTAQCFGPTPFITSPESDGETWSNYNTQQFIQGPFEMTYDAVNKILYSGSWTAGLWALRVA